MGWALKLDCLADKANQPPVCVLLLFGQGTKTGFLTQQEKRLPLVGNRFSKA